MFNILHKLISNLFGKSPDGGKAGHVSRKRETRSKPAAYFTSVIEVDKTPRNDAIGDRDFIMVVHQRKPLWALFRCPCGCGNVISLSLQKLHSPHWRVKKRAGMPSLYPSVWQNKGCCSHFWIKKGCVQWCLGSMNTSVNDKL
jgi:Family of unknown function (DUF6527)